MSELEAHSAKIAEMRARAEIALSERVKGYPYPWGPTCHGCGGDEYRIDGFCSIECRDYCNDEDVEQLARDVIALTQLPVGEVAGVEA